MDDGARTYHLRDLLVEAEQYVVDGVDGRDLGVIDEVVIRDGVVAGIYTCFRLGRRREWIPADAVVAIEPSSRRVIVRVEAQPRR
jgi:hypothetical protein